MTVPDALLVARAVTSVRVTEPDLVARAVTRVRVTVPLGLIVRDFVDRPVIIVRVPEVLMVALAVIRVRVTEPDRVRTAVMTVLVTLGLAVRL